MQVLEVGGECVDALVTEEGAHGKLYLCLFTDRFPRKLLVRPPLYGVQRIVFVKKGIDFFFRNLAHILNQIADSVIGNRPADLNHGFNLVAVGNRDIAHIVAEAADAELFGVRGGTGGAHPLRDPRAGCFVFPVTGNHLAGNIHTRGNVPELAVAVRGLIQIMKSMSMAS